MQNHEDLEENEEARLEQDCRNKVMIASAYGELEDELIEMSSDFESMTKGHLGHFNI